jgi:hypothetical protein
MKSIQCLLMAVGAVAILGSGCSTYKDQAKRMNSAWQNGQTAIASKDFGEKADNAMAKDAVVWHLEAGAAYRAAADYTNSLRHLDAAAAAIDDYEQQAKVKVASETGAILSNQQNLPYRGKSYDKIMLHTYQALNYLALGDPDKARPEINRAYQCQQDAVDDNARRIEKAKEQEEKSKDKATIEKTKADPAFSSAVDGVNKNIEGFKFYANYVNPFTVYLDGLFFLYQGSGGSDLEHAGKSLNRVVEVCGDNKFVQADLQTVTNAINGQAPAACTYVFFETGEAASLDQIRIDIPIIVTRVSYVGTAFPKLAFHDSQTRELSIKAGDVQETAASLANMDAIIALDFKNEFPVIITKTVISTVTKAVAAYAANKAVGDQNAIAGLFTQIGTAVAQMAVNIADTRSWTTLPKEFQVARVPTPADRKLTLSTPGSAPVEVNLLDGSVNVVYAKSIRTGTPLLVSQFKLK